MSLYKNQNFVILFSGQIVSVIGDNLFGIALLWYVLNLTHSKADLAVTSFASTVPPILGILTGVWVDRWLKKWTMIGSDLLRFIILMALFFVTLGVHPSFSLILLLVVLLGVVGTVFSPSFTSVLPYIVSKEDYTLASGWLQSSNAFASLGGMLGGGALMALLGAPLLFLTDAVTFLGSVLSLLFVRVKEPSRGAGDTSVIEDWKTGMRAMMKSRFILQMGLTAAVNNFSLAGFDMAFTAWVKSPMHGNAFTLSLTLGAFLIGVILGGLSVNRVSRHFRHRPVLTFTTLVLGLSVSLTGVWANLFWEIGILLIGGAALGVLDGVAGGLILVLIPGEVRGRVTSTLFTMGRIATPLGVALLGLLMIHIPLWVVLMLTGIGPLLGGLSFLLPTAARRFAELDAGNRVSA